LDENGVGCIAFSPLAQGLLTDKYINGIPELSRAAKASGHLQPEEITFEKVGKIRALHSVAKERKQSLAQLAIAWLLKDTRITSVLVGASSEAQLLDNLLALDNTLFTADELAEIERILK
jgi:L-glyceraldehyde 3-phosphate reductase